MRKKGFSTRTLFIIISLLLVWLVIFEGVFKLPFISERDLVSKVQEVSPGTVLPLNNDHDFKIFGQVNSDGTYNVFEFTKNPLLQHYAKEDFHLNLNEDEFISEITTIFKARKYEVKIQYASLVLDIKEEKRETSTILSVVFLATALVILLYVSSQKKVNE